MVQFSKVNKNFRVLTLHGHNVHRQQRQLSKFLMRYRQFTSLCPCKVRNFLLTFKTAPFFCVYSIS